MNLKRIAVVWLLTGCNAGSAPHSAASAKAQQDIDDRLEDATHLLKDVGRKVPPKIAERAECAVVIPALVRGGFILGARYGRGFAICRTDDGISAPAPVSLSGGSAGLQVGLESVDILMVIASDAGRKALLRGRFSLGADASVAAGPLSAAREGSTDPAFRAEVLTYSRSSGLFAGAELSGAVVEQDQDATRVLYGKDQDLRRILAGEVATPRRAHDFVAIVEAGLDAAGAR